jgi:glycosyltransferase involved in cell wall biosynthesis
MTSSQTGCELSVVVPIYNEVETLPEFECRLRRVLDGLPLSSEVILVNDGSQDASLDMLRCWSSRDSRVRVIDFSRNFGHQAALYAGLCRARGSAAVLMDGDLQDPPEVIAEMVRRWHEGYEVVYAVRRQRKEGLLKRLAYAAFYRLLHTVAYLKIPLDSGDFSLLDRRVVAVLREMPERNKFLRGLRTWAGFRQTSLPYERDARYAGHTKYSFAKLLRLAFDGIVSYSYVPLRLSYAFGLLVSGSSFALAVVYLGQRLFSQKYIPQGFTTIAILILFLGGVQLLSLGLVGEYIGRIYDEVKRRPEFVERELIGFNGGPG